MQPIVSPSQRVLKLFRDFWLYCILLGFSDSEKGMRTTHNDVLIVIVWSLSPSLSLPLSFLPSLSSSLSLSLSLSLPHSLSLSSAPPLFRSSLFCLSLVFSPSPLSFFQVCSLPIGIKMLETLLPRVLFLYSLMLRSILTKNSRSITH